MGVSGGTFTEIFRDDGSPATVLATDKPIIVEPAGPADLFIAKGHDFDQRTCLSLRVAFAQELRAAGLTTIRVGELLGCPPHRVPWYCDPAGFSIGFFPLRLVWIDPAPSTGGPVAFDEWGTRHDDFDWQEVRLAIVELGDQVKTICDLDKRETHFVHSMHYERHVALGRQR